MTAGSTLAILDGSKPGQRVEVVLGQRPDGGLAMELRDQHYAEGIGWFDQRTLVLEPHQIRQLRQALGCDTTACRVAEAERVEVPVTLPFPGSASTRPRRRTVADLA